jgi:hypothetical protein
LILLEDRSIVLCGEDEQTLVHVCEMARKIESNPMYEEEYGKEVVEKVHYFNDRILNDGSS